MKRPVLIAVGAVVALLVLVFVVPYIVYGHSLFTADVRGKTSVREKTVADGDYRIAQYDKFYNLCGDITAVERKIKNMKAQPNVPTKEQYQTNLLALSNQRETLIAQYNADSRKAGTQAQFKASDLPYSLDPTQEQTTC